MNRYFANLSPTTLIYADLPLKYLVVRTGEILILGLRIHLRKIDTLQTYLRLSSHAEKSLKYLVAGTG